MLTSGVYHTQPRKWTTAVVRYNRIQQRRRQRIAWQKVQLAIGPRLVKKPKS